jgi:hypothetical protein
MGCRLVLGMSTSRTPETICPYLLTLPVQPVDLTLLDKHFGTIKLWQEVIDEIHERKMWVVLDNTMATYVTSPLVLPYCSASSLTPT